MYPERMGGGISHKRDVLICECALFNHVVVNLKTANDAKPAEYYALQLSGEALSSQVCTLRSPTQIRCKNGFGDVARHFR